MGIKDAAGRRVGTWLTKFAEETFKCTPVEELGGLSALQWLVVFMESFEESEPGLLAEQIESGVTLWDLLPAQFKNILLADGSWMTSLVMNTPSENIADMIHRGFQECSPDVAGICTLDWLIYSLDRYKLIKGIS